MTPSARLSRRSCGTLILSNQDLDVKELLGRVLPRVLPDGVVELG